MDYYQNEAIVQSQLFKLESMVKDGETITQDLHKSFVIVKKFQPFSFDYGNADSRTRRPEGILF